MKKILFVCMLSYVSSTYIFGKSAAKTWQIVFGGEQISMLKPKDCPEEYTNGIARLSDGSYVIAGNSKDCKADNSKPVKEGIYSGAWAAKIAQDGSPVWFKYLFGSQKTFGGDGPAPLDQVSFYSLRLLATSDGGVLAGGMTGDTLGEKRGTLVKFDTQGNLAWDKLVSGTELCNGNCNYRDPFICHYQEQPDKDILTVIMVSEPGAGYPMLMALFSPSGSIKKVTRLAQIPYFTNSSVAALDGGFLLSRETLVSYGQPSELLQNDINLYRYDANGRLLWHKVYGKPNIQELPGKLLALPDGSFVVTATEMGDINHDWMFKVNAQGEKLWELYTQEKDSSNFAGLTASPEGDIVAVLDNSRGSFMLQKYQAADGKKLWSKKHAKRKVFAQGIVTASDEGYVIGGYTQGRPAIVTDGIAIKTDWEGNLAGDAKRREFPKR